MTLIVHALSGDERVNAYVARRKEAERDLAIERGTQDAAAAIEPGEAESFEALISAELANVDALSRAYKDQGVNVTTLGKYVPPSEPVDEQ